MNRFVYALFIFVVSVAPSSSFCNVQVCDADLDVYTSTALELYALKHKLNLKNHIAEIAEKLYGKKEAEDLLSVEQFMRQICKNSLELKDNPLKFYTKVLKDFSPNQDSQPPLTRSEKASKYAGATYRAVTESPALHKALKIGEVLIIVGLIIAIAILRNEVDHLKTHKTPSLDSPADESGNPAATSLDPAERQNGIQVIRITPKDLFDMLRGERK